MKQEFLKRAEAQQKFDSITEQCDVLWERQRDLYKALEILSTVTRNEQDELSEDAYNVSLKEVGKELKFLVRDRFAALLTLSAASTLYNEAQRLYIADLEAEWSE